MERKTIHKQAIGLTSNRHKQHAQINCRVSGFNGCLGINNETAGKAINRLPDQHIAGLKLVKFDPHRLQQQDKPYWQRTAKGEFIQNKREVLIYQYDTVKEFEHVLYHEIGHYMFYLVLNQTDKKHWVTQLHYNEGFLNAMCERNASEEFAECYAAYILKDPALLQLPRKQYFIQQNVFLGLQY